MGTSGSPQRPGRTLRQMITAGSVAALLLLSGTSTSQAGVATEADSATTAPAQTPDDSWRDHTRPLDQYVPQQDVQLFDMNNAATRRVTNVGLYIDQQQVGFWQNSDAGHAEAQIRTSEFIGFLDQARSRGAPLTYVSNHPPCPACEDALVGMARLASERGVQFQAVFTHGYTPSNRDARTRFGHWVVEMSNFGAEMLMGEPAGGLRASGKDLGRALTASQLFTPPPCGNQRRTSCSGGGAAVPGPATEILAGAASAPGGIDLSSLELRYVAEPGDQGFEYAFNASEGRGGNAAAGLDVAEQQSDAFFVWLSLPPSDFWVNLNPNEPDRIVDRELGSTNAGRVLLEADLQLKQSVGELIHPDTDLGTRFWNELDANSGDSEEYCLSFRQWIVPKPATVYEDDGGVYILDAPLEVKLETEYLESQGVESPLNSCPGQSPAVEEANEATYRSLILPRIQEAVNHGPLYADLRRVYLSRVAAEWYRQRSLDQSTVYGDLINSGDVTPWTSRGNWRPRQTFDAYVDSYSEGEFDVTRETRQGNLIVTNTYFYGGVDFANVEFDGVRSERFEREWPELSQAVEGSFAEPTNARGGELWLGSASAAPRPAVGPADEELSLDDLGAEARGEEPSEQAAPAAPTDESGSGGFGDLTLPLLVVAEVVSALLLILLLVSRRRRGRTAPTF